MHWEHCTFYSKQKHESKYIKIVLTLQNVKIKCLKKTHQGVVQLVRSFMLHRNVKQVTLI